MSAPEYFDWECPICGAAQADEPGVLFTECSGDEGHLVDLWWGKGDDGQHTLIAVSAHD